MIYQVASFLFACFILLPIVITLIQNFIARHGYRKLPGPPQKQFGGNLSDIAKDGAFRCIDNWVAKYGKLFTFRLLREHLVVVADPDVTRSLLYRLANHAPLSPPITRLVPRDILAGLDFGLVRARDDYWRGVRAAWQPAFSPASLRGYQELFDREALALTAEMAAAAGEQRELDFHSVISRVTLAVVGTAAYGVDFNSPEFGGSGSRLGSVLNSRGGGEEEASRRRRRGPGEELSLVQACNDVFRSSTMYSSWLVLNMFPCLMPLGRPLAQMLPDRALSMQLESRKVLTKTAHRLMNDWRAANLVQAPAGADGSSEAAPAAVKSVRAAGGGVAPGSFLGLMLAAREKGTDRHLTDAEIQAQVETFLLAGFDTTANALSFAMYLLAGHPDKAARMQRELDEHLPPLEAGQGQEGQGEQQPVTMEILDKLVYMDAVLKEAMRLHPPAPGTSRQTDKPMEILGHQVPAGASLYFPVAHIHRDPELWPEPEAFVPERFLPADHPDSAPHLATRHPHAHLPFGGGSRMCIGFRFANQEAKTVLARLFQRLDFQLSPGQVPLAVEPGMTQSPKHGVWVTMHPRAPQAQPQQPAAAAATTTPTAALAAV